MVATKATQRSKVRKRLGCYPKGWCYEKIEALKRLYQHNNPEIIAIIIQKPVDEINRVAKRLYLTH